MHEYAPNQKVLKKVHDPTKLVDRITGPFNIIRVHVNGTMTINLQDGITKWINI